MKLISHSTFNNLPILEKESFSGCLINDTCDIFYIKHGKYHREDGPAKIWVNNNSKEYYLFGKLHREDGPAIIRSKKVEYYYKQNMLHRLGGPAICYYNGNKPYYSLYDVVISKEKHDFLYSVYLESEKDYVDLIRFEGFI